MFDPPIYITVRDRVTALRRLVSWLEKAGHQNIVLLDNDSTYGPCTEFLEQTPHQVVRLKANIGARCAWQWEHKDWFVVTDPDIVPIEECPLDAVQHFRDIMDTYPLIPKAGFGFYLEDLPPQPLEYDRGLMQQQIAPGLYASFIDTTFALYRPGAQHQLEAIRTGMPYMARHDCPNSYLTELTDEDTHYLARAKKDRTVGSSWAAVSSPTDPYGWNAPAPPPPVAVVSPDSVWGVRRERRRLPWRPVRSSRRSAGWR